LPGSAKFTNEGAYLFRKFGASGHQHRPPGAHLPLTTVTGVANTWGYGAMTNRLMTSKRRSRSRGRQTAPDPASPQHLLEGAEPGRISSSSTRA
jgi:formate dehydrogenase major subunit